MNIHYLGPNTFSEKVAKKTGLKLCPHKDIFEVFRNVKKENDAIVAYCNKIKDLVPGNLDLIYSNGFYIVDAFRLNLDLCLGGYDGEIYSHPVALSQCNIKGTAVESTGEGIEMAKEGFRCLASKEDLEKEDIPILKENLVESYTEFFRVSKNKYKNGDITLSAFIPENKCGSLEKVLHEYTKRGLNHRNIHSSFVDGKKVIYLETEGNVNFNRKNIIGKYSF